MLKLCWSLLQTDAEMEQIFQVNLVNGTTLPNICNYFCDGPSMPQLLQLC